jgi:hypothetical protein
MRRRDMTRIMPRILRPFGCAIVLAVLLLPGAPLAASELDALAAQSWPGHAAPPSAPSPPGNPRTITVFNYNKADNACRVWSDGCRNCTLEVADGRTSPACSNIGIACQPGAVTCASRDVP